MIVRSILSDADRLRAAALCCWCNEGRPHHQLALTSIGGPRALTTYDIHEIEDASGVGLAECRAARLWDPSLAAYVSTG